MKRSLITFTIALIISLLIILLFNKGYEWLMAVSFYFFLLTTFNFRLLQNKLKKNPRLFISTYLASTMIRLFLHVALMVVLFVLTDVEYLIATLFLANYVIFSVFEVFSLLSKKNMHTS